MVKWPKLNGLSLVLWQKFELTVVNFIGFLQIFNVANCQIFNK